MDEPILQNRKFCNVFRELDFNTQFLIANVINQGDQSPEEILFRSILFRVFNKPLTWKLICDEIGAALPRDRRREEATWIDTLDNNDDTPRVFPSIRTYNELASTKKSYVAIIPNIKYRYAEEYGNGSEYSLSAACYQMSQSPKEKLKGLRQMQALYLAETLLQLSRKQRKFPSAPVAEEAHQAIKQLAFFGDFLAYQLLLDLNYAPGYDFDVDVWAATGNGSDEALGRIFSKEGLSHHRLEAMQYIHSVQHTQWTRLRSKYPVTPQFALPPSHPSSGKIGISLVEVEHSLCEFNKYSKKQTKEAYKSAGRRPTAILPRKVTEGGDD
ncbi:hypothetical protein MNV49_006679 [Pseudohyphozyma bogoriensis]|nr:hypothetical protein MNV49_006679 [Pseudohyphozyma bogoriensis]